MGTMLGGGKVCFWDGRPFGFPRRKNARLVGGLGGTLEKWISPPDMYTKLNPAALTMDATRQTPNRNLVRVNMAGDDVGDKYFQGEVFGIFKVRAPHLSDRIRERYNINVPKKSLIL